MRIVKKHAIKSAFSQLGAIIRLRRLAAMARMAQFRLTLATARI